MNKCQLQAPKDIQNECPKWEKLALQYLEDVTYDTVDMHHIEERDNGMGVTPVDRIKTGTVIELQDESRSNT